VLDELGERWTTRDGAQEGKGGADEAGGVEDRVEAEVSEVVGCLVRTGKSDLLCHGSAWEEDSTREVVSSSGTSRKERMWRMSSEGRVSIEAGFISDMVVTMDEY
jgi:hypothetical protein